MSYKLRECPFCHQKVVYIAVHDSEGNYHGELGCDYEHEPWSGLSYALHHSLSDCLLYGEDSIGHLLFDTEKEAADYWNAWGNGKDS